MPAYLPRSPKQKRMVEDSLRWANDLVSGLLERGLSWAHPEPTDHVTSFGKQIPASEQATPRQVAEGATKFVVPQTPGEMMMQFSPLGFPARVTAAMPRPFKSTLIDRIRQRLQGGYGKGMSGREILESLEGKGVLPRGYGEYYLPTPKHAPRSQIAGPSAKEAEWLYQAQGIDRARMAELIGEHRSQFGQPVPKQLAGSDLPATGEELLPHLEQNWVNPRVDVKSSSLSKQFVDPPERIFEMIEDMRFANLPTGKETMKDVFGSEYTDLIRRWSRRRRGFEGKGPMNPDQARLFGDAADDYFELLLRPGKGRRILSPEALQEGGHWKDPSVMAHVRGERVGDRLVGLEAQSDWNRWFQLKQQMARDEVLGDFAGEAAGILHGDALPLPPDMRNWPEASVKATLRYGAMDPSVSKVSFVDDLIQSAMQPGYTPSGLYSKRIPGFMQKYAGKHGGRFHIEDPHLASPLTDIFTGSGMRDMFPSGSRLSTIDLGDWGDPFRKFLRGQQPLPAVAATPFLYDFYNRQQQQPQTQELR